MDVDGEYRPLQADEVQEIYASEEVAKTVAHIGSSPFVTLM